MIEAAAPAETITQALWAFIIHESTARTPHAYSEPTNYQLGNWIVMPLVTSRSQVRRRLRLSVSIRSVPPEPPRSGMQRARSGVPDFPHTQTATLTGVPGVHY